MDAADEELNLLRLGASCVTRHSVTPNDSLPVSGGQLYLGQPPLPEWYFGKPTNIEVCVEGALLPCYGLS